MHSFSKKLLVLPAALSLLATGVQAEGFKYQDLSQYSSPSREFEASSDFNEVIPSDWSYQALKSIHKSHGCKVVMPKGALSRYEAAALLNACLANAPSLNDQEQKLVEEFGPELAQIRGTDIDGSEGFSQDYLAGEFSTTSQVSTEVAFSLGATDFEDNSSTGTADLPVHMAYSYKVNSNTSFTGEDSLIATLAGGNYTSRMGTPSKVNQSFTVDALYYTRAFGDFIVAGGPLFEMHSLVVASTSSYSDEGLFNKWAYAPNRFSNYDKTGDPGFAIAWANDSGWNAGVSFIAGGGKSETVGIMTDNSNDVVTASIGYDGENYGGGVIFTQYDDPSVLLVNVYGADDAVLEGSDYGNPTFIGFGGYWQMTDRLDVSAGIDLMDLDHSNFDTGNSWSVGVDYDVLQGGTLSAGVANVLGYNASTGAQDDAGIAYELYYTYELSDGVTVKPMIMVHSLDTSGSITWNEDTIFGLETIFKF
tara:strand:+ start:34782 stop:36212 length:1431 start_codon:yes stop_codon:yes gene_type:complete